MNSSWSPKLGALPVEGGVLFRVWAPVAQRVEVVLETKNDDSATILMNKESTGHHVCRVAHLPVGTLYRYRIDGNGPFPDPVSRYQPHGVHGPSQVVNPDSYKWNDQSWKGPESNSQIVIYELHVGTFTQEGTFAAAQEKIPELADLGVTAIELMPLADFPGQRGWGYDGVCHFAPVRCYGQPDDLRSFVDTAHKHGLSVLIDVVYNHLGPDGNYLSQYSPFYYSTTHHTDWGQGLNFDGEHSNFVEEHIIENALHWIHEYHFDGVRLDATHAIRDEGEHHILELLTDRLHQAGTQLGRKVLVIAEDERNLAALVKPRSEGGFGMDAVWADDFHHQIRRALTGEKDGYYADYSGSSSDLATTLHKGWFYCGQTLERKRVPRGTDPTGIPPHRFIFCIQNHDQIGNRAFGERLNHQVDRSAYRAVSALLLTAPQTPLLFMGQEWCSTSPFLYFTDHVPEVGEKVTEGRRREFHHFEAFTNPTIRMRIPDPQSEDTFLKCKLNWNERQSEPYAGTLKLYRDLLQLRRSHPAFNDSSIFDVRSPAEGVVFLRRTARPRGDSIVIVCALRPGVVTSINEVDYEVVLTTEEPAYTPYSRSPTITIDRTATVLHFPCPATVILRNRPSGS